MAAPSVAQVTTIHITMGIPAHTRVHVVGPILFVGALLFRADPCLAQVAIGDILVNNYDPNVGLRHYRPDGTLVASTMGASGTDMVGAAITPSKWWVTSYRSPTAAIGVFDPSGVEQSTFPMPLVPYTGDVSLFEDGTIAACNVDPGRVELYSPTGVHQGTISAPGMARAYGSAIDSQDELWVCDLYDEHIWHFARDGTLLGAIGPLDFIPAELDFASDGSLWVMGFLGEVRHYTRAGVLLSTFQARTGFQSWGIAVAPDGSLWVTGLNAQRLAHFDPNGNLLGEFPIPYGAIFMDIPVGVDATIYCSPAIANSTGNAGLIGASGSATVSDNDVTLHAANLPLSQFGYFLNSMTQAFVFPVPTSQGALCLGGQIGRYNASIFNTGATGTGLLSLDLANTPTPSGNVAIAPGETWNFTCWYRDQNPGPTSNFTDGVSILFQ